MDKEQALLQQFENMNTVGVALGHDDVTWLVGSVRELRFRINKMRERIAELEDINNQHRNRILELEELIRRMDAIHHSRVSELEALLSTRQSHE